TRTPKPVAARPPHVRGSALPLSDLRILRTIDRCRRARERPRSTRRLADAGRRQNRARIEPHAGSASRNLVGRRRERGVATRRPRLLLRGDRGRLARRAVRPARACRAPDWTATRGDALTGERGDVGALRTPAARSTHRHDNAVSATLGIAIPFWLDRADEEAVEIARTADRAGIQTVWVGEMASFDTFALATAIGLQTERVRVKVGPLAVGVRSPVTITLNISSITTLISRPINIALGAS